MEYSCKLSSEEFRKRKETVIRKIKEQVAERQSLSDGYLYSFEYSDKLCDELIEFVKTERLCCTFFQFDISFRNDKIYFTVKGDEGVKDFIQSEIEL